MYRSFDICYIEIKTTWKNLGFVVYLREKQKF